MLISGNVPIYFMAPKMLTKLAMGDKHTPDVIYHKACHIRCYNNARKAESDSRRTFSDGSLPSNCPILLESMKNEFEK